MATQRRGARAGWVPDRGDVVWIDCNPQAGREMRDIHPFLVLSPSDFNDRVSLVLGLPMSTAAHNAGNPFAVNAGVASSGKTSWVLCQQPKSVDWRVRAGKPHPGSQVDTAVLQQVCAVLNQILQLA
ncbi:MAG: type II toxin-antitoxin system PemK/MazF family toxin [Rubrivivax sp.]|nr:type II toxin-antitoxin system PemK/MazF family toxin [Rubrivivax sp.]